jgi:hypothetical protein
VASLTVRVRWANSHLVRTLTFVVLLAVVNCTGTSTDDLLDARFFSPLAISPKDLSVSVDDSITVTVKGGLSPYSLEVFLGEGSFNGSVFSAPGVPGTSIIAVTDKSGARAFGEIKITQKSCPMGYVAVEPNTLVGQPAAFCIAKYEMKCAASANGTACSGIPISQSANKPWVNINQQQARDACATLGSRYHLVTKSEWMATARSIEKTAANWSRNSVGVDYVNSGNSGEHTTGGWTTSSPVAAADDSAPCANIPVTCTQASWNRYSRTHTLQGGDIIWDISGNAREWVDNNVAQNQKPYVNADGAPSDSVKIWKDVKVFPANNPNDYLPLNIEFDTHQGDYLARTSTSTTGMTRGGLYTNKLVAGPYCVDFQSPTLSDTSTGFRCTYK